MDCCKKKNGSEIDNRLCPSCNKEGSLVDFITVQSLLKSEIVEKLEDTPHYRYCKTYGCPVAYFAPQQIYRVNDLKVKATHKDHGLDVPVCYCFNYTRGFIKQGLADRLHMNVLSEIKAKMKDPGCFCETSNPQGACCLGNVSAWISECKAELEKSSAE